MKRFRLVLLLATVVLGGLSSCAAPTPSATAPEHFNKGNLSVADELYTINYV